MERWFGGVSFCACNLCINLVQLLLHALYVKPYHPICPCIYHGYCGGRQYYHRRKYAPSLQDEEDATFTSCHLCHQRSRKPNHSCHIYSSCCCIANGICFGNDGTLYESDANWCIYCNDAFLNSCPHPHPLSGIYLSS